MWLLKYIVSPLILIFILTITLFIVAKILVISFIVSLIIVLTLIGIKLTLKGDKNENS